MKRTSADTASELGALPEQETAESHLVYDQRCDACPGTAVVVVHLASGRDLVLCGNHARRYAPRLLEAGATIIGNYSWDAGFRPALGIRVPLPSEGDSTRGGQGRESTARPSRWQRLLGRFKTT